MYEILEKTRLNQAVVRMSVYAPLVAKKAQAGQFVILCANEGSERIPLTIHDSKPETGSVSVVYQVMGAGTMEIDQKECGDSLSAFVGPLGKATRTEGLKKVCVIGGGVGCAIAFPVAKKLHEQGAVVHCITGFRNKDLVILENEMRGISDKLFIYTDDGSYGEKGQVTKPLEDLLKSGEQYDEVIAIGPLIMMKFVSLKTREYGVKTTVSMNPVMVDGTGMCGGCRLSVNGEVKFACVDGPDFDGHQVDFDEVMSRNRMYEDAEKHCRDAACRLLEKGETQA